MSKQWIRRVAQGTILLYLFQIRTATVALANSTMVPIGQNPAETPSQTALYLDSDMAGLSGPISFGVEYDTLEKTIFNAQFVQSLNKSFAIGMLGEYGINQYRLNGTAGYQLYSSGAIKLGAEYLSQVLPFEFDSGSIDERVYQAAYGARFQHNLNQRFLQNLNVGAYWAQAPNQHLSSVNFISHELAYINQRHIVGATSQGLDLGTTLRLSPSTSLDATLYYDDVSYNHKLTDDSDDDDKRLGAALQLNQLIGDNMKFSIAAENRAIYDTYDLELAYKPSFAQSFGMEIIANAQRLISSNDTPNSNTYGLNVSFLSGKSTSIPPYTLSGVFAQPDLAQWVKTPSIYMDRVLAISEETTTLAPIKPVMLDNAAPTITSITPNAGPLAGGTVVTIAGTNLTGTSSIAFGGTAGTSISSNTSTSVKVTTPAMQRGLSMLCSLPLQGRSLTQMVLLTMQRRQ